MFEAFHNTDNENSNLTCKRRSERLKQFIIILLMLVLTTILNIFLEHYIQPSSLIFVYIVPAIAGAIFHGTWSSVLIFTAGFLIFDYGFVEPYYSLHISKPQDIYNVTVYFTVAALITYLINIVRHQNAFLKGRLDRVSLIDEMSRDFLLLTPVGQTASGNNITASLRAMVFSQMGQLVLKYIKSVIDVPAIVFFQEPDGSLKIRAKSSIDLEIKKGDSDAAIWSFNNGEVSGSGTYTCPEADFYFIPVKTIEDTIGVTGILYNSKDLFPEQRRLLGAIINLAAIVASVWMNMNLKRK